MEKKANLMGEENLKISDKTALKVAIIAFIGLCIVSVVLRVFLPDAFPSNLIGAVLGAVIGAIITFILLVGQTSHQIDLEENKRKLEEDKIRNIHILEMKTKVFKEFINSVWKVWEDQIITIEKFEELTGQYYKNVMIYLKEESKLKAIGNALTNIGNKIDKTTYTDSLELRENIVTIINTLSEDIGLGGKIDMDIMDKHDKIVFPLIFKNQILEDANKVLPEDTFENGKFEFIQEFRNESSREYLCFDFKKYKGCKIVIDGFDNKGDDIKKYLNQIGFSLFVDTNYHKFDDFRIGGRYKHRINFGIDKTINLLEPVEGEKDAVQSPQINFTDEKSMEKYRTEKSGFAPIFARRIKYWFDEIKIGDYDILKFLKEYYEEQT